MEPKQKKFRISRAMAADFERVCTVLGISEREAAEQALKDWLKKNQLQTSIETWTRTSKGPVVFHNLTLIKLHLTIVKKQLETALEVYRHGGDQYRFTNLEAIKKIFPTALSLASETNDPELQELIKQVESLG